MNLARASGQRHAAQALRAVQSEGSAGDVSGPKPGFFDFGTARSTSLEPLKGMKRDEAMQKYVDLVKKLGG